MKPVETGILICRYRYLCLTKNDYQRMRLNEYQRHRHKAWVRGCIVGVGWKGMVRVCWFGKGWKGMVSEMEKRKKVEWNPKFVKLV